MTKGSLLLTYSLIMPLLPFYVCVISGTLRGQSWNPYAAKWLTKEKIEATFAAETKLEDERQRKIRSAGTLNRPVNFAFVVTEVGLLLL